MASTVARSTVDEKSPTAAAPPDADRPLRVSAAGLARLRTRLEGANQNNPDFAAQFDHLMAVVSRGLELLRTHELAPLIELALADGAWAHEGIDLRTLPESDEIYLEIVVRLPDRDYDFDTRLSAEVFAQVNDGTLLFHFSVITQSQWHRALEHLQATGRDADLLGIPVLVRA